MKVYNCGMISSLATQKPNDGATQYTKAINGNSGGGGGRVGMLCLIRAYRSQFYLMRSASEVPWDFFFFFFFF